jgi:CheY-like chemotaxis protein
MARILVVEDDPETLGVVADSLRDAGHEVIEATDGREAFVHVQRTAPEVIVLDLWMSVMDGETFANAADKIPGVQTVPIVLMSGASDLDAEAEALRPRGVRAAIRKPFNLDDLCATIERVVREELSRQTRA